MLYRFAIRGPKEVLKVIRNRGPKPKVCGLSAVNVGFSVERGEPIAKEGNYVLETEVI